MYMPVPAMHQAMMAPNGPVAVPKVRGIERCPARPWSRRPSRSGRTRKAFESLGAAIPRLTMPMAKSSLVRHGPEQNWIGCNSNEAAAVSQQGFRGGFPSLVYCTPRVRPDIG